ncbi:hypothetical protein DYBT9275_01922 [Dyadobacter sp. CECT 9275]|uniref:Outer membrane protein beta-barrel domain-containing protein n=1 Tax=Dyadobacter helix TaxID=2822344 RepID=A0A916N5F6_9BACT|nr:hypothetical protein [Dyadobacter sp. CECT 9275]CAG4998082.1 hypothetical protein DYBT9275_01922 [Dyadobacter sp. CECT 9275]
MKTKLSKLILGCGLLMAFTSYGQENQTLFVNKGIQHSGGYAAISNKFTTINGEFANMPGIYGGWFINRKFMLGIGAAATTNYIPVPDQAINFPEAKMTYQYGQFGLMTEYVIASTKKVHFTVNLLTGSGFTMQYDRRDVEHWDDWDHFDWDDQEDPKFFFLMEPGAQVEFNLFKWMRFSPGVSYRRAFGAKGNGLSDADLSNISYNVTLKFGAF